MTKETNAMEAFIRLCALPLIPDLITGEYVLIAPDLGIVASLQWNSGCWSFWGRGIAPYGTVRVAGFENMKLSSEEYSLCMLKWDVLQYRLAKERSEALAKHVYGLLAQ